jgi:hypothetical protein
MTAKRDDGGDPDTLRCGAKTQPNRGGKPCRRYPRIGTNRCPRHGGSSPQVQAKARQHVLQGKALVQLARMDTAPPVNDPLNALARIAGEITRWKDLMAQHVADLKVVAYSSLEGGEQIKGEVLLYERALDRTVAVLAAIAKLNIDERLAAISERQAVLVERAVLATLDGLDLTVEQRTGALRTLSRHLRVVGE